MSIKVNHARMWKRAMKSTLIHLCKERVSHLKWTSPLLYSKNSDLLKKIILFLSPVQALRNCCSPYFEMDGGNMGREIEVTELG